MIIDRIRNRIRTVCHQFLVDHYPRFVIDRIWQRQNGYKIDWNHPTDINEKIQWLICYGDTSRWPDLADKYKVRKYVIEKGYEHLLPKLYGVWEDPNKIDYDELPDKFVLKCNHDSGSVHIVDKLKGYDKQVINSDLNNHLKLKFGYLFCEPHYNKIKARVIAEEYLEDNGYSNTLVDYKVWCFNGHPYCVLVVFNRSKDSVCINSYDLDWNVHPEHSVFTKHFQDGKGAIPKPKNLETMLTIASDLAGDFPEVRVDFYEVNGTLYFGEMTFTSACGRMNYYTKDYLIEMGQQIKL
jgi:hypothetical protein